MSGKQVTHVDLDATVRAAAGGDRRAWETLVTHLMPMIVATIEECGLSGPDAAEVNQTVWLRVVEWLEHLRHPAALPKWIDTTTRRECLRVQRTAGQHAHLVGSEDELMSRETEPLDPMEAALREEQYHALRTGFAQLPDRCRELLSMLLGEPPMSYRDIVTRTGMRIGSIGPTQRRCLDKLRASPTVAAQLERGRTVTR
ncbi:RNA polymerase sigma factor [Micromonospora ureilytica]|uniref:RNA polymerase sigma factor (Sigma-70 family) n=1 Tax=Micromonospora ureilytica TaxID=709868 RepID=A0ABS0JEB5_9ACTN|nr:sigma-70 family RNA polymerase sigma factor [Micromonospora ureilytica]MBG6065017.1 RNA polymerase sigma factor (sigma-70 family) [Micromonospora ureilytica]